jgi:hypothetical protein
MIGATNAMTSSRSPDCPERYLTVFPTQPKSVDLTKAVSTVATTLEHLALNNLVGVGKQAQGQLWKDFSSQAAQVNKLCE